MLLGKLCEREDKTALMCMHAQATAVLLFEMRKLIYKTTRIITSTIHPALSVYLRETYRICNFLANCCDYTRKQYEAPISLSPEVYETSSKTGSGIRILYLLTGTIGDVLEGATHRVYNSHLIINSYLSTEGECPPMQ